MPASQIEPIYSSLADDPDFACLVEMYVDEMPERMEQLRQLFQVGDWRELNRMAHQMKGSAGGYGFDPITPFAARLERRDPHAR
jgi:HPt (histidine-containing phosphotransfer) domain-containing protein